MITFFNILYSFIFSVISNSYIFIRRKPILALLFFIVFLLLNNATDGLKKKVAASYNKAASLLGDTTPDFLAAVNNLTSEFCKDFDSRTQTPQNIYCQSVGSVMHGAATGKFPLNLSHEFVKHYDGANDGLVGVDSFKWSENYTLLDLPLKRGISHGDMIDLNRENIKGFDVREFYVKIVSQLKSMGL